MPDRYLIESHGPDVVAIRTALTAAEGLAEKESCDVVVIVPVKETATQGVLNQIIPEHDIKGLLKGETRRLGEQVDLRMDSWRAASQAEQGIVVAMHLSPDGLAKVDQMLACKAIIVIPWVAAECVPWRNLWSPTIISRDGKAVSKGDDAAIDSGR